ncbi:MULTISPECIES: hypothetical protein [unclassified Bizionia]|uniref:hypothetical protein n=1 Tax=unclassified Bizionia TaxID=2626393 RepID=UPI0020497BA8|nr:hypothetical protein [Bizionia sp. M204]UPS91661.1 hypothetical protein GMA17_08010 [Bizionia sp. M204]
MKNIISNSNENVVLLMTGTVKPNTFATLALKDPDIRREQYVEAISYYLTQTNLKIVFVENSGVLLADEFEEIAYKNRLEFLTFSSQPSMPDKGKGAKELEIINYAMDHSKFINESNSIIKITGRLKILNIMELTSNFLSRVEQYRCLFSSNIYKLNKMDARCFFFTKDFFPYLKSVGQAINIKYSIEMALWDSALKYCNYHGVFKQLKRPLRVKGVNAGFGTPYEDNFTAALAKGIRHYFRAPYFYRKMKNELKGYTANE